MYRRVTLYDGASTVQFGIWDYTESNSQVISQLGKLPSIEDRGPTDRVSTFDLNF